MFGSFRIKCSLFLQSVSLPSTGIKHQLCPNAAWAGSQQEQQLIHSRTTIQHSIVSQSWNASKPGKRWTKRCIQGHSDIWDSSLLLGLADPQQWTTPRTCELICRTVLILESLLGHYSCLVKLHLCLMFLSVNNGFNINISHAPGYCESNRRFHRMLFPVRIHHFTLKE